MKLAPGIFLRSTDRMTDPGFKNTRVYIFRVDGEGTVAFMQGKVFGRVLNELTEFQQAPPLMLWAGGPVSTDKLFILHRRPDIFTGSEEAGQGWYFGGNIHDAIAALKRGEMGKEEIQLYLGYCGWDARELEAEIEEGSWIETAYCVVPSA